MKTKLIALLLTTFAALSIADGQQPKPTGTEAKPIRRNWEKKQFNSIVAQRASGSLHRNMLLIDFNDKFAWMGRHHGDARDFGGGTTPGVFVYSKSHDVWIQILEVSTAGAKFGKQLASPQGQLLPALWDFTDLALKPSISLPIASSASIHLPDKVVYDETRDVFVVYSDSRENIESATTTLLIPKKDLLEAFEHFVWTP